MKTFLIKAKYYANLILLMQQIKQYKSTYLSNDNNLVPLINIGQEISNILDNISNADDYFKITQVKQLLNTQKEQIPETLESFDNKFIERKQEIVDFIYDETDMGKFNKQIVNIDIQQKAIKTLKSAIVGLSVCNGFKLGTSSIQDIINVTENTYLNGRQTMDLFFNFQNQTSPITKTLVGIVNLVSDYEGLISIRHQMLAKMQDGTLDSESKKIYENIINARYREYIKDLEIYFTDKPRKIEKFEESAKDNGLMEIALFHYHTQDLESAKKCLAQIKNLSRDTPFWSIDASKDVDQFKKFCSTLASSTIGYR